MQLGNNDLSSLVICQYYTSYQILFIILEFKFELDDQALV